MLLFRIFSIFIALLAGYLGYFYSKNVVVGLFLVAILGFIFPAFFVDSSFIIFSLIISIILYFLLIMILKKKY